MIVVNKHDFVVLFVFKLIRGAVNLNLHIRHLLVVELRTQENLRWFYH